MIATDLSARRSCSCSPGDVHASAGVVVIFATRLR